MRKSVLTVHLSIALVFAFSSFGHAAPGKLDHSFGVNGIAITSFGGNIIRINAAALQSDGKIVGVGRKVGDPFDDFAVVRYTANGTLDLSFDEDGLALTPISTTSDVAWDVALQADGKIVVVGDSGYDGLAIVRYNRNGSLDTTFDEDGKLHITLGGNSGRAEAVAIQPDGKIIVTGLINGLDNGIIAVVRLNENGSLDTSFGNNGRAINASSIAAGQIYDVGLQSDGKIVVCGFSFYNGTQSFAVARYNLNGTIDNSFDEDGVANTPIGSSFGTAHIVYIQADGKILIGGYASTSGQSFDFALARYNENGSLDNSFGSGGKILTNVSNNTNINREDVLAAINVLPDGKIIAAGYSQNSSFLHDFALVRYHVNGTLDTSYGINGKVFTAIGGAVGSNDLAADAVLQPDGKIVVVGYTDFGSTVAVARYLSNGTKDFDFDGDGKSDVSTFRPNSGAWYLQQSTNGFTGTQFGASADQIVPTDFDGDGKTDLAVYRSGTWYIQRSQLGFTGIAFGTADDIPIPADYDGDGNADIAVFRPSTGVWYLLRSNLGFTGMSFGQTGDKPVPSDYDGDGKADIAVFRNGTWYIQRSSLGFTGIAFGESTDKPVPADYDGDGKADLAVFRPSNGTWYLQRSQLGFTGVQFGLATDFPVPADYDGDGKTDVAVFRDGNWYLNRSTQGFTGVAFGAATDKPVPNAFIL